MKHFERPIIEFSNEKENACITLKDACGHIFVTGSTGSGKSSGSMNYIIQKMLLNGCGGLVLSVKSEIEAWQQYCNTAREKDLIVVGVDGKHSFNFLEYESSREASTSFISNIVTLLNNVIQANKEKNEGHGSDDAFWANSLKMLMHNCITVCMIAYSKVTIPQLYEIALSVTNTSPDSAFEKALAEAKKKVQEKIELWEWRQGKEHLDSLDDAAYNTALFQAVPETRQLKLADQFFIDNFRKLSEKTRSIVELSFIGFLFNLLQEPVYSLFCSDKPSTFTPESCLDGKIILLDLPIKQYGQAALYAQIIFKEIWQKAMERRDVKANNRVCFLVSDECQEMLTEADSTFLATARSSHVSVIYATQNLPSLYAKMGGAKSEYRIKSLLGNFNYKIMHCNSDVETNSWASSLIGEAYQKDESETVTSTEGKVTTSQTVSVKLAKMVRPEAFASLRTGGPQNDFCVTAYLHAQGKKFASGFSHKKVTFNQQFKPL